jgi:hypothetical protein
VLFESRPLDAASWILPLALSVVVFLAVESLKAVLRARGERSEPADTLKAIS